MICEHSNKKSYLCINENCYFNGLNCNICIYKNHQNHLIDCIPIEMIKCSEIPDSFENNLNKCLNLLNQFQNEFYCLINDLKIQINNLKKFCVNFDDNLFIEIFKKYKNKDDEENFVLNSNNIEDGLYDKINNYITNLKKQLNFKLENLIANIHSNHNLNREISFYNTINLISLKVSKKLIKSSFLIFSPKFTGILRKMRMYYKENNNNINNLNLQYINGTITDLKNNNSVRLIKKNVINNFLYISPENDSFTIFKNNIYKIVLIFENGYYFIDENLILNNESFTFYKESNNPFINYKNELEEIFNLENNVLSSIYVD
jgi:hypothetical protein